MLVSNFLQINVEMFQPSKTQRFSVGFNGQTRNHSVVFNLCFQTSTEGSRPWERPWSVEEMRKEANNWSLSGDAGVRLQYIFPWKYLEWSLGGLKKGININLNPPINLHPDLCPVCNTFFGVPTVHGFNFFWHSLE